MMAPELHPDDLLDKEARGDLTFEEDARLAEHLVACSVCRFERQVRADFREEFEAARPRARTTPQPPEAVVEMRVDTRAERVERVERDARRVLEAEPKALPAPRTLRALRAARPSRSRMRVFVLVAAALLVASAAAAEWSSLSHDAPAPAAVPRAAQVVTIEAAERVRVIAHGSPQTRGGVAAVEAPNAAEVSSSDALALGASSASASIDMSSVVAAPAPCAMPFPTHDAPSPTHDALAISSPTTTTPSATTTATEAPEPPQPPTVTAGALFSEAGEARQHGAYDEAVRLYGNLAQQYPGSSEAATAHAILGRMLLDRGDASGALFHFDQYLRTGGALREEALLGRALSLQRMGVTGAEATAWRTLLDAYPQSVHAARARARLAALGER